LLQHGNQFAFPPNGNNRRVQAATPCIIRNSTSMLGV
jgi:hypothetical protein